MFLQCFEKHLAAQDRGKGLGSTNKQNAYSSFPYTGVFASVWATRDLWELKQKEKCYRQKVIKNKFCE